MKQRQYVTPMLTVVQFKAEHGYATSGGIEEAANQINWIIQQESETYYAEEQEVMETERTMDAGYWGTGGNAGTWF